MTWAFLEGREARTRRKLEPISGRTLSVINDSGRAFRLTGNRVHGAAMPFFALFLCFLSALLSPVAAAGRPNFVVIVTDDMSLYEFNYMPKTQRLIASQGMEFRRYYHNTDLCCPSRTTLMSGRRTHNHGVLTNYAPIGSASRFFDSAVRNDTIAVWLKRAGYQTAMIGKFLNGYLISMGRPPGWDRTWLATTHRNEAYDYDIVDDGTFRTYGQAPEDYFLYRQTQVVDEFLKAATDAPFLVFVTPPFPHEMATPAPDHLDDQATVDPLPPSVAETDRSDKPRWVRALPLQPGWALLKRRADRWRCLQGLDDMVEKIVGRLRVTGKLDDTYILFLTDNGFHIGEHGIRNGKVTGYEESAHGRLYVRGPGIPAGVVSDALVGSIDIAVTLAALAGVSASAEVDGRSLSPLLRQKIQDADWPRETYAIEGFGANKEVENDQVFFPRERTHYFGLVTRDGRKIIKDKVVGFVQYYDLVKDPYEMRNMNGAKTRPTVTRLLNLATRHRSCKARQCRDLEEIKP